MKDDWPKSWSTSLELMLSGGREPANRARKRARATPMARDPPQSKGGLGPASLRDLSSQVLRFAIEEEPGQAHALIEALVITVSRNSETPGASTPFMIRSTSANVIRWRFSLSLSVQKTSSPRTSSPPTRPDMPIE